MKKFLFYFLISILLVLPVFAANQTQTTKQNDIEQTITLINQAKYDAALKLIYFVKVPSNKEERALYYLAKIKALESTPYYANNLVESKTDPTKFTNKQKQDAIKQSYKELWNLRTTLVNMPYADNEKYLFSRHYINPEIESLYDALIDNFIYSGIEENTKIYEESYKLGGKNRDDIREYWHIQYINAEIEKQKTRTSLELYKEQQKDLAELYAAISGYNKNYNGKYKQYFFEAKTLRGKYESALQSGNSYEITEQFEKALKLAEYCIPFKDGDNDCKWLKDRIESPNAYIVDNIPQNYKPNTVLPIKFQAKNIKQVNFKLYKLSLKQVQDGIKDFKDLKLYKTYTQDLTYDKPYTPKDFTFELPGLERGFYYLTFNKGDTRYSRSGLLNITDLALLATSYFNTDNLQTLNYKDTSINFYTLSAHNGQPISATVSADKLTAVQTNQAGQANVRTTQNLINVVAKYQNNYALINYLDPQRYNTPNPISIYINTDRSIYKPGEEVKIVFNVVENKDNKHFTYQGQDKLNIQIRNASYKEVAKEELPLDNFGQAVYTFKVPQDTMFGNFSINAKQGKGSGYASFQVEEFKQPEFTLTLNTPEDTYSFNKPVTIDGKATYYSGENLANAKVKYTITKRAFYPCCYRWDNFEFENEDPINAETKTDKDGNFKITFKPKAKKEKVLPARYFINVEVTGKNGHTIKGGTSLYVANQKYFFSIEKTKGFFLNDTENTLTLKMQNAAGKPQKGKAIFEVFEAKLNDNKNIYYYQENFNLSKEPIFSTELEFVGKEIIQKLPVLKEGFYGVKLKAYGNESEAFIFPIFDSKNPSLESGQVTLSENKKYIVGENAKILLGANKAKGPKYVEIYKKGFFVKRLQLSNQPLQFLTLPILPEYQGGISLRWLGVYDYESFGGTLNIEVPYIDKDVDVKLNAPENLEPGKKAELNLTATVDGKPLQNSRAMITVYDKALDYYKPHNFNLSSFYTQMFSSNNMLSSLQLGSSNSNMQFSSIWLRIGRYGSSSGMGSGSRSFSASRDEAVESASPMLAKNAMVQNMDAVQNTENNDVRTDFAPTAYFNPKADLKNGKANFNFTMPDSLTEWTAAAIVFSETLQTGKTQVNFKTSKDLTLRLETPTFLRQNDEISIKTLVKNNTKKTLQGEISLTLNLNGQTVENVFANKQVFLKANEEKTLTWRYIAPKELGEITLAAAIRSGDLIDGETRTLPLLTSVQYLPNSKTIALKEGENNLQLPSVKEGEILNAAHLTLDTSLLVPVVSAMPLLSEQTFKTATSTIDRYLPIAIINQLNNTNAAFKKAISQISRKTRTEKWNKQTAEILLKDTELSPWYSISKGGCESDNFINIFDSATVAKKQKEYETDLKKYQNSDGGFAWIKGGKSSLYMTLYIVDRLAQASYFGVKPPMEITQNALKYLHSEYKKFDFTKPYYPFEAIYYAYVISAFDKTLLVQSTRQEVQTLADYIDGKKEILAPLGHVYMAVIYHRLGDTQKVKKYINMLFETAQENDITGTSFAMEERSWQWFHDSLNLHAEALRMLLEVDPSSPRIDGLIKWIIFNKKATMWGSTTSAAKAVYSLLDAIKTWGVLNQTKHYDIAWNGADYKLDFGPLAKENKTVFSVYEPQANNESLKAKITQNTTTTQGKKPAKTLPSFATLSNLVISDLPQEASPKGILNITKAYYLIKENTVRPLRENETIKVGDKIEVRLTIKAEHNFNYVMIQDKKPAAFDTEKLLSGWVWDGLSRYEDLQLAQTNFFMDYVPVGTYELKYVLRPTASGVFNVGSSIMQSMFAPEVSAHSNSFIIKVED